MFFWEMPEPSVLCPPPEDYSDILSPTRQRREREEFAGNTWDERRHCCAEGGG